MRNCDPSLTLAPVVQHWRIIILILRCRWRAFYWKEDNRNNSIAGPIQKIYCQIIDSAVRVNNSWKYILHSMEIHSPCNWRRRCYCCCWWWWRWPKWTEYTKLVRTRIVPYGNLDDYCVRINHSVKTIANLSVHLRLRPFCESDYIPRIPLGFIVLSVLFLIFSVRRPFNFHPSSKSPIAQYSFGPLTQNKWAQRELSASL